ncbi:MAG: energy transducer TonB [Bacteroidales bacterium]|nr:energy transducer TonB [Bacteroidales bacterium]
MSERSYGIIGTLIIHNIILLILIFSFLALPNRSSSEGALIINFGETETAGGLLEPAINNLPLSQPAAAQQEQSTEIVEDGILTQDFEEAPAVRKQEGNTVTEKQPETRTAEKKPAAEQETAKPAPVVNPRALYSSRGASASESGSSEGIYQGSGNMGDPQGAPESDDYTFGLGGSSIGFSLDGRNPIFLQKPEFSVYTEGIIVVEITVDRNGTVISATPGIKGSTLVDNTLYAAVRKAALESKFNVKNDARERQIGTITYHFKLE